MAEVVPKVVPGKEVRESLESRVCSIQTLLKQETNPRTVEVTV